MISLNPKRCDSIITLFFITGVLLLTSCRSNQSLEEIDSRAYQIVRDRGLVSVAQSEAFTIQNFSEQLRRKIYEAHKLYVGSPASLGLEDLPSVLGEDLSYRKALSPERPSVFFDFSQPLTLHQVLALAAENSRDYRMHKEKVFEAALDLDLAAYDFGFQLDDFELSSDFEENQRADTVSRGLSQGASLGLSRQFLSGSVVRSSLALDLVQLLGARSASAVGLQSDHSVSIPLLRGRGGTHRS